MKKHTSGKKYHTVDYRELWKGAEGTQDDLIANTKNAWQSEVSIAGAGHYENTNSYDLHALWSQPQQGIVEGGCLDALPQRLLQHHTTIETGSIERHKPIRPPHDGGIF